MRDISVRLDRYPNADEKLPAREIHESGGGPVPTALVTLARLGDRTAIASTVGDDPVGQFHHLGPRGRRHRHQRDRD